MKRLEGKVALITGGARGMGATFSRAFIREGAKVIITDILEKEGAALSSELGAKALFLKHDVTDVSMWQAVIKAAIDTFGTIDILVNNAGILALNTLEDTSKEEFTNILNVNLLGPHLGHQAVAPIMKKAGSGSIINMSSVEGLTGANGVCAYAASKWGLRGLTKVAALELGPFGIRVNSIHPGGINTLMANPEKAPKEVIDQFFSDFAAQRIGEPEEVASAAVFLASDESSYCMGSEFVIDGGMTAGHYFAMGPGAPNLDT